MTQMDMTNERNTNKDNLWKRLEAFPCRSLTRFMTTSLGIIIGIPEQKQLQGVTAEMFSNFWYYLRLDLQVYLVHAMWIVGLIGMMQNKRH